jgi:hypothetical protein
VNALAALALLVLLATALACVAVAAWLRFCSGNDPF